MNRQEKPQLMSIRQVARTGVLPEHFLRQLQKRGILPGFLSGRKFIVNYSLLLEMLNDPTSDLYRGNK